MVWLRAYCHYPLHPVIPVMSSILLSPFCMQFQIWIKTHIYIVPSYTVMGRKFYDCHGLENGHKVTVHLSLFWIRCQHHYHTHTVQANSNTHANNTIIISKECIAQTISRYHIVQVAMRAALQMECFKSVYCGKCCILEKKETVCTVLHYWHTYVYHKEAGLQHLHNNCEQIDRFGALARTLKQ